jgi:hypothetical protein
MAQEEQGEVGKPYTPGKKKTLTIDDVNQAIETQFKEKMGNVTTVLAGFAGTIKRLDENQTQIVSIMKELKENQGSSQGVQGQGGETGMVARDIMRMIMTGNKPDPMAQLTQLMLHESLMMTRTIRMGMMKRLNITDLMLGEEKEERQD